MNLAVNRADGILEVNPVVGVRHQPIERIVAELNGSSFHAYIPPTTSVHIGYIMPEGRYHPCLFGDEAEVEEATADMVDTIVEYGLSLMIETSQTQALLRALCNGAAATQEHVAYRLPVTYVLMGERDHARAVLGESVERLGDRGDPAAQRLRDYAIAFAKWVEQTENSDRG